MNKFSRSECPNPTFYEHSTSQNCHPKYFFEYCCYNLFFPPAVFELPRLSSTSKELLLSLFTESLAVPLVFPSYAKLSVVIGFLEG